MHPENQKEQVRLASADSGFTVLEVLISLMLLSLLLMVLPSTLRLATAVWTTGDTIEKDNAAAVLVEKLRTVLQEAKEEFSRSDEGRLQLMFDGTSNRISFLALSSSGPARSGLYRFEIASSDEQQVEQGVTFTQSSYRSRRGSSHANVEQPSVVRKLANTRLSFEYFGEPEKGKPMVWQQQWHARASLPELVAIHIETRNGRQSETQTLVVPLKLGRRVIAAPL